MSNSKYPLLSIQRLNEALKKKSKSVLEDIKKKQALRKELNAKVQEARRKAFEKESIKQAEIKARVQAKMKYGVPKKQNQGSQGFNPFFPDVLGTPKKKKKSQNEFNIWDL